ncbi:chymotrypsin family serine protease [Paenibacillus aestuarii]|uniref:Serine protease n=1 Tax=Paenibacillus aestuarii TaxID=516965 RepID=A0ABW0K504_9BACL|nr:hypothetical protein [Paenibacillus aestuarii]
MLEQNNIKLAEVSTNIIDQKVDVYVQDLDESKKNILNKLFNADAIRVFKGKPMVDNLSSFDKFRPLQAGVEIRTTDLEYSCTIGFLATDNNSSSTFLVTAGHCMHSTGEQWGQGSPMYELVATATRKVYSGSVDAAAMKVADITNLSPKAFAYGTSAFTTFKYSQAADADTVGDTVCSSQGRANITQCGILQTKSFSGKTEDGVAFSNLRKVNFKSISGDSGSPMWAGFTLMGVLKGNAGDDYVVYSHIANVNRLLSVTPVLGY